MAIQNQIDLDNKELITVDLLPEVQVQSEVNVTIEFFKSTASVRIVSFLNYVRTNIRTNYFISALGTNAKIYADSNREQFFVATYQIDSIMDIIGSTVTVIDSNFNCDRENPIRVAGFFYPSFNMMNMDITIRSKLKSDSVLVNGFFAACTPFEALLRSTLDCLYDIKCLNLLSDYFPNLNQVCFILSSLSYIFSLCRRIGTGPTIFYQQYTRMFL